MNRKPLVLIPILLLISLLPLLFFQSKISTDIKVLLPRDQWIDDHLDYLRNSQIGAIIAISFEAENTEDAAKLPQVVNELANRLEKLPDIRGMMAKVETEKSISTAVTLFNHLPQTLKKEDLQKIQAKIQVENLKPIMKDHYETILRPGGLFRQKMIASDPLNLFQIPLKRLQHLGKDSGFKFKIQNSRLMSLDGRHALMILYTDIPVTNPGQAKILFAAINKKIANIPVQHKFSHLIISGHRHAIDNRKLLQRDILITLLVAGIGFFLLFAFFFKDWKAFFVFIIPIIGMICAVGLTLTFFREPSAIIIGLGATVIGIALDYGIHVFVAAKHTGTEREKALNNIRKPLIFSALTTLGVFWAFFFSGTPGYHQLAFASTCGVGFSLLFSLVCLPLLLPSGKTRVISPVVVEIPSYTREKAKKVCSIWLILAALSLLCLYFTDFEPDIRKLDGISQELREDEANFKKIWGENSQGSISVKSANIERGMQLQDKIANFAEKEQIAGFKSLSQIWPSKSTRQNNIENWNQFWQSGKEIELRENLTAAGKKYSFSPTAFKPFFDKLYQHDSSENLLEKSGFKLLTQRFINFEKDGVRVSSYFTDSPDSVDKMKKIAGNIPEAQVISPSSFGNYISTQIITDAMKIAITALCLVIILAYSCLKNPAKTFVAMLPVFSAILIIIPVFSLLGMKINAVALVACIVVTGLAIDYGIFVVSACDKGEKVFSKDASTALCLSVLSTVIGAAALLFAGHPALRSVGLVISSGVISGYLGAVFIAPAVYQLICKKPSQNE